MKKTTQEIIEQDRRNGTSWLSTGIGSLDAIWGGGLPSARIVEMHSEFGLGMTKIALQLAADVVKSGLNVAYFDVARILTLDLEQEFVWGKNGGNFQNWGQFDVYCPTTFSQVAYTMENAYESEMGYDLIIIDSLSCIQMGDHCANNEDENSPGDIVMMEFAKDSLVKSFRNVIDENLISLSVLVLNNKHADTTQAGFPNSPWSSDLDNLFDIRTAIAPGISLGSAGVEDKGYFPIDLVAWNTKDYRFCPCTVVPLVRATDGSIDEAMSLATFLVKHGVIKRDGENYSVLGEQEPIAGLDRLRDWAEENIREVMNLAEKVVARTSAESTGS
ncbi:MAG: hypothetical protein KOO63_13610 [Bacteroidales bacterium]|nr:hypothetical protein [Candidatus Latescibacterota bacterium]